MRRQLAKNVKRGILRRFNLSPRSILAAARQIIDDDWYFSKYPSAAKSGLSALDHYIQFGAQQNNDPCLYFQTEWYQEQNPDVVEAKFNPLLHYIQHGWNEGRAPSPLFDGNWYRARYLSGSANSVNPLLHYLTIGQAQGNVARPELSVDAHRIEAPILHPDAHQIIDDDWYFSKYPLAAKLGLSATEHYLNFGVGQGNDPCQYFWTKWYQDQYPDVVKANINPLLHYLQHGGQEGRAPSPLFDSNWYNASYLSGSATNTNPLLHYLTIGRAQGNVMRPDLAIEAHRMGVSLRTLAPVDHIRMVAQKLQHSEQRAFYQGPLQPCFSWLMAKGEPVHDVATTSLGGAIEQEMDEVKLFARAPYHAYLNDVTILPGSSTLIASDGTLLNDEITFVHERFNSTEMKLAENSWLHNGDLLLKYNVELTPTLESGIHLFKEYEQNYFHFIFEVALKLHLIEREGLVPPTIPLLVSNDLDGRLYDMINLLKHPDRQIIKLKRNVPYRVNRLFYLSDLSRIVDAYESVPDESFTFMSPTLVADFARYIKEKLGENNNAIRRRLFLMRSSERRGLVNQRDIVDSVLGEGFEATSLELLSLAGQVKIMSEASVVIGATGAAFANMVWCAPGTRVMILYPDHPLNNRTFWNRIGQAVGLQITYLDGERQGRLVGKHGMHDDFRIGVDTFSHSVRDLISGNA